MGRYSAGSMLRRLSVDVHAKLLHAATEYDRKQSTRKGYNRFALGHYCRALQNVRKRVGLGHPLRDSIITEFCGILCDRMLKAASLPIMTDAEARHGLAKRLPELPDDE